MRALRFEQTGSLSALQSTEMNAPELEPGEVLVRIVAAGLNPSDVKNVEGYFSQTTVPRVPGRDFAGVVARGPSELVGRAVWGTGKELGFVRDGTHAEYVAVPRDGVARKPEGLDFEQAASAGVPYTTAWAAMERCGVTAGTTVVVTGANGAVGGAAMSLASWRGARVTGTVRRRGQAARLESRGARILVVEEPEALSELVYGIFPAGAEVILDTTGAYLAAAVSALAPEGRIVVIAAPPGGRVEVPILPLYRRSGVIVGVDSRHYDTVECARMLDRIARGFDDGRIVPPEDYVVTPFTQALSAYEVVKAGGAAKHVLVMNGDGGSGPS